MLAIIFVLCNRRKCFKSRIIKTKALITVQHGSADTVVRAMYVKYRKWRLGKGL